MGAPLSPVLDRHGVNFRASTGEYFSPDHDGATIGARLGYAGLGASGPTASAIGGADNLRRRARHAYRNNPYARSIIDSRVSNLVGTDISPEWLAANEPVAEAFHDLWQDSQHELDFYGTADFYGLEEQVARAENQDGEVIARLLTPPRGLGLMVPLQVQLLEADHLPLAKCERWENGNEIRYGIEYDRSGRRVAYHLERNHPGESVLLSGPGETVRVPAAKVLHVFRPLRPGQARAVSPLGPVILALDEIDQFTDAALVRQKIASFFAGAIETDGGPAPIGAISGAQRPGQAAPSAGGPVEIKPGTFPRLRAGEKLHFYDVPDTEGFKEFLRAHLQRIAAGACCTYEQVARDLESVNYTSIRAGLIEFRRALIQHQHRTILHQFCRPVINAWMDAAVLAGMIPGLSPAEYMRDLRVWRRVRWNPQGFDFTDPVKDRIAVKMDIRDGLDSRASAAARMGRRVVDIDRANAVDKGRADELGLLYDTYPGHVNDAGTAQVERAAMAAAAVNG